MYSGVPTCASGVGLCEMEERGRAVVSGCVRRSARGFSQPQSYLGVELQGLLPDEAGEAEVPHLDLARERQEDVCRLVWFCRLWGGGVGW